jgi:hypothetical protein
MYLKVKLSPVHAKKALKGSRRGTAVDLGARWG